MTSTGILPPDPLTSADMYAVVSKVCVDAPQQLENPKVEPHHGPFVIPLPIPSQALLELEASTEEEDYDDEVETLDLEGNLQVTTPAMQSCPKEMAQALIDEIYRKHGSNEKILVNLFQFLIELAGGVQTYNMLVKHSNAAKARQAKVVQQHKYDNFHLRFKKNAEQPPQPVPNPNIQQYNVDFSNCTEQQRIILDNLIKNISRNKHAYDYDDFTYQLAFKLNFYSESSLREITQVIPLPCYKSLRRKCGDTLNALQAALPEIDGVGTIITELQYPNLKDGNPIRGAVAIDAVKVNEWSTADENSNSYLFALYFLPLDSEQQKLLIATLPHVHGKCSEDIRETIYNALEIAKTYFRIPYVCTDGDSGYHEFQKIFFEAVMFNDFQSVLITIKYFHDAESIIYITDIIHYAKNRRTMLIFYNKILVMSPFAETIVTNIYQILAAYDIGDALLDTSRSGAMQDEYPLALFSIPVLKACIDCHRYGEAIYIASVAFWLEAIRNPVLDKESRLDLLAMAYTINQRYYNIILSDALPKGVRKIGGKRSSGCKYFFAPKEALERALATIAVHYYELANCTSLNFSRLTTMSLEHLFGRVRLRARYNDSYQAAVRNYAAVNYMDCSFRDGKQQFTKIRTRAVDFQTGQTFDPSKCQTSLRMSENRDDLLHIVDSLLSYVGFSADGLDVVQDMQILEQYLADLYTISAPFKIKRYTNRHGKTIFGRYCTDKGIKSSEETDEDETNFSEDEDYELMLE